MKFMNRSETTTTEEPPQTGTPQPRNGVDSADTFNGDGKSKPDSMAVPSRSKTKTRIALLACALVVGAASAAYYFRFVAPYESTDNAFIEGYVIPMASQVPGRVGELLVKDNQAVKQGDVLLKIDPRDYEASLAQARADLAAARSRVEQAKAQVKTSEAKVAQAQASVVAADAENQRAADDLKR